MIAAALALALAPQAGDFAPDPSEWSARDLEGRWILVERETAEHGWARVESLIRFLEEQRETELLEWLVLYPRSEGQSWKFEQALARLEAPQWARAVEWSLRQGDSHTAAKARGAFAGERAGLALDWLERHEDALSPAGRSQLESIRANELPLARVDAPGFLPPRSEADVLAHLDPHRQVLDLGDRKRAEAGVTYLHQVERELRAVAHAGLYGEPWRSLLVELTRHERPEVRALAWLAIGEAKRETGMASSVRDSSFLLVIDDRREDDRARSAALMALSQRSEWDPRAWTTLHAVARERGHPGWSVAVSRLGDVGDEFTLELLAGLPIAPGDAAGAKQIGEALGALRERARLGGGLAARAVVCALERTAFADVACSPIEAQRSEWTRRYFFAARRGDGAIRSALVTLLRSYVVAPELQLVLDDARTLAPFGECVREWAAQLTGLRR